MNVLIVDDSKAMRCIVARSLREMGVPGTPYLEAANGKAALETIAASRPDLVISDLNMPEMSGMELLRHLRGNGDATPFGFVTSEASAQLRQEAADAGASFVVTKPFTAANLSLTIGPLLAQLGCRTKSVDSDAASGCVVSDGAFPKPAQIASTLTELLRRNVTAAAVPAAPVPVPSRVVAEYRSTEDGKLAALVVCDLAFAVRAASVLTLIPAGAAEEAIRARGVQDTLADNLHEVLNVMARFLVRGGSSRVKLGAIHMPDAKLDAQLAVQILKPAARLDLAMEISGYGKGMLTLASIAK